MRSTRHIDALANILKRGSVVTRGDGTMAEPEFLSYGSDRTREVRPEFHTLVFPADTDEVAAVVRYCVSNRLPLVPSGGRTGLSGGAVAAENEIVLSLKKLNRVLGYDPLLPALSVQAGVTTAEVQQKAREHGHFLPIDLAASGSSQIGGNIATNAGGTRVIRYGMIREWVLGLTVVTGAGEILRFPGNVLKNNTGIDLKQLFIGSEGTLGIVTEATLRLAEPPGQASGALFALTDFTRVTNFLAWLRDQRVRPLAFEYFDRTALKIVCAHLSLPAPFDRFFDHYVFLEWDLEELALDPMLEKIERAVEEGIVVDARFAETSAQADAFWKYREGISESLSLSYTVHKNDISAPIPALGELREKVQAILDSGQGRAPVFFGHIGDGNLHLNVLKADAPEPDMLPVASAESDADFFAYCRTFDRQLYGLLRDLGGSISAEHGIGTLKRDFLSFSRSPEEIEAMRRLKALFDPAGILNPGKVFRAGA